MYEIFFAEAGIQPEHHIPQEEIAEGIKTVFILQLQGLDDIAQAFGHLALIDIPVAVDVQMPVRLDPGGLQHGGPVNAVGFQNIFGDEVLGHRPEGMEVCSIRIAWGGDIVDEGVKPDVGDVVVIKRQRDPPGQTRLGTGDTEILQGIPQEGQHFILITFRADKSRMILDVMDEPVLIFAHPKEVVTFLTIFRLGLMIRATVVHELLFHIKPLAADTIVAFVVAEIDVPGVIDLLQNQADGIHMILVSRPDKIVVGNSELWPEGPELSADLISVGLGRDVGLLSGLRNFIAMFVRAGQEKSLIAGQTVVPGQHVSHDGRIGMADVRRSIDVINRCGDKIGFLHQRVLSVGNSIFGNLL